MAHGESSPVLTRDWCAQPPNAGESITKETTMKLKDLPPGPMRDAAEQQLGKTRSTAPIKARRGRMNKTESLFADEVLENRKRVGEIIEWRFESVKLIAGAGCYFTPDFYCLMPDGSTHFFEIKGHRFAAGIVRLKAAALLWPQYKFTLVMLGKGGRWNYTPVG